MTKLIDVKEMRERERVQFKSYCQNYIKLRQARVQ